MGNVERTVWRIYMLILGCKELSPLGVKNLNLPVILKLQEKHNSLFYLKFFFFKLSVPYHVA